MTATLRPVCPTPDCPGGTITIDPTAPNPPACPVCGASLDLTASLQTAVDELTNQED